MAEQLQLPCFFQEYARENPSPLTVLTHIRKWDIKGNELIEDYFSLATVSKSNLTKPKMPEQM